MAHRHTVVRLSFLAALALSVALASDRSADGDTVRGRVPIVVAPGADALERLAGRELTDFLGRMYPGERFVSSHRLPPRGNAIVIGTPASASYIEALIDTGDLRQPGALVVKSAPQQGRSLGIIAGADSRAVLHAVYALLEALGCGFYISHDAVPERSEAFDFRGWDLTDVPLADPRIIFNWHNFLSSCSTWDLPEWRQWIRQAARMRYTGIMVHAYGNNPMVSYTHNGETKPLGYLSTTARGRDWGTQHVNDVRRLHGCEGVFDGPVFGSSAALVPDEKRATAAKRLMRQVFAYAAERGVDAHFALDVDTDSSNPPNVIMTLPESARLESSGRPLANPDTPEGFAYYETQIGALIADYPQLDQLVIWFRSSRTLWRRLTADDFPAAWQAEYRRALAAHPEVAGDANSPSMFAIAKIVRACRKILDAAGRRDITLATGTWGFGHMPAAHAFMPPRVAFLPLDTGIQFGTPAVQAQLRAVGEHRPVVPIVWAHHDDRTYIGRPYTPFPDFATRLLESRAAGFGIIHWTTRPLDIYFKSLARQVWTTTRDEDIERTCSDMAARSFGPGARHRMARYLTDWISGAPQFGRETSDRFISRPLTDADRVIASCRERLETLHAIDISSLSPGPAGRLEYFRGLEQFMADFHRDQSALQESGALLAAGDLQGAREALKGSAPEATIERYVASARACAISPGEKALAISMNLRWLPYFESQRQALGLAPVRINFQPTSHDPLAQGAGHRTFHVDPERRLWIGLGERETGVPTYALPAARRRRGTTWLDEICRTGIESDAPVRLQLRTITGGRLSPGLYRVQLLIRAPSSARPGQRVFHVELRGSGQEDPVTVRVEPSGPTQARGSAITLIHPLRINQGFLDVRLAPVEGSALLCGAIIAPRQLTPPEPVVRTRLPSELPIAAVTASASVSATYAPQKTTDLDLRTRWAADGDGHWIQYDLGRPRQASRVSVGWYRGNERQYRFDILTSLDGAEWAQAFTGQSTGATLSPEPSDCGPVQARYIRIMCHGNSANTWNSITDVAIHGQ